MTLFANGTKLELDGAPGAAFSSFIPKSANWGFTFAPKRLTFTARWNYRGLDKRAPWPRTAQTDTSTSQPARCSM